MGDEEGEEEEDEEEEVMEEDGEEEEDEEERENGEEVFGSYGSWLIDACHATMQDLLTLNNVENNPK